MDYGKLVEDAFAYTKEGIFKNTGRWVKLMLALVLLGIPLNGYIMRIYRGTDTAPEVDRWGNLIIDGLKLLIVGLIYAIPIIILWFLAYGSLLLMALSGNFDHMSSAMAGGWAPNLALVLLIDLLEIVIAVFVPIASIRFARTGSFREAFNFSAILETIGKIGWINYIIAIVFIGILIAIPIVILAIIFIVIAGVALFASGFNLGVLACAISAAVILFLILAPLFSVFQARYMTRVYESAEPVVPTP
jgi:hypothetical protein